MDEEEEGSGTPWWREKGRRRKRKETEKDGGKKRFLHRRTPWYIVRETSLSLTLNLCCILHGMREAKRKLERISYSVKPPLKSSSSPANEVLTARQEIDYIYVVPYLSSISFLLVYLTIKKLKTPRCTSMLHLHFRNMVPLTQREREQALGEK